MNRYRNKAPYSTLHPSPEHWTRKGNSWKQKVCYESEDDACEFLNTHPRYKEQGMTVYRCSFCNKYHVGHKNDEIKDKEE